MVYSAKLLSNSTHHLFSPMSKPQVSFLPFHALAQFMRDDYRQTVIRHTMNAYADLPEDLRANIDKQTKKFVTIPGFRNSIKAPLSVAIASLACP